MKRKRKNPSQDKKSLVAAARKWFEGAEVVEHKIKVHKISGNYIQAGEVHLVQYSVPGQGGFKHNFKGNATILVKPGANHCIIQGRFKFNPERGFINR